MKRSVSIVLMVAVALSVALIYFLKVRSNSMTSPAIVNEPLKDYKIAFLHRDNNVLKLYVIPADGSSPASLIYESTDTTNPNIAGDSWMNSSTIRFVAMKDGEWTVFSIKDDGSDLNVLGPDNLAYDSSTVAVTIDPGIVIEEATSTKPVMTSTVYYVDGSQKTSIYTANISGWCNPSDIKEQCDAYFAIGNARLSPDKQYVALEEEHWDTGEAHIVIAYTNGGGSFFLTDGIYPTWSPQ